MTDLEFDGQLTVKGSGRFNLAVDSLALYTDFGFKASMTITLCMLALALAELVYTLIIFATGTRLPAGPQRCLSSPWALQGYLPC